MPVMMKHKTPPALRRKIDTHAKQPVVEASVLHGIGGRCSRKKSEDDRGGRNKPRLAHAMNHGFPPNRPYVFLPLCRYHGIAPRITLYLARHRAARTKLPMFPFGPCDEGLCRGGASLMLKPELTRLGDRGANRL